MRRSLLTAALAVALTAGAGCTAGADDGAGDSSRVTITVFAAASLKEPFSEIGKNFQAEHAGIAVRFSFAGSSDLVAQIQQGAPADVFASADTATMDMAREGGLVDGSPRDFATNTLQIATPPDNPADIDSMDDLATPGVRVVVCATQVPCGAAAAAVQKAAGVTIEPVSEEQSVTDVLGKVMSGEADAGLVYITDVRVAGDRVHGVAIPEADAVINTYPVAALRHSRHLDAARAFTSYVTQAQAQSVLSAAGFGTP